MARRKKKSRGNKFIVARRRKGSKPTVDQKGGAIGGLIGLASLAAPTIGSLVSEIPKLINKSRRGRKRRRPLFPF